MTTHKIIAKLLKFKGFKVVGVDFKQGGILQVAVKHFKNGARCCQCERRGTIIRVRPGFRQWRDIPVAGWEVKLVCATREIYCPTHGRVEEWLPWADQYSRVSYRFEYLMLRYSQMMTQKAAAELLIIPKSTLSDQLHRCIKRIRNGHRIRGLTSIGIDEVSYKKRHKYATLVYDLDRSVVVWVGEGKGRETIDKFFDTKMSDHQKQKILTGCCDMSEAYIGAITAHCPNATLVIDRFHLVKALNKAVDEVRLEQWREASASERKAVKGLRWLLYRHSSTRTKKQTRSLNKLEKHNRRIYRAWKLKDEFESFWDFNAPWAAERFLKRWMTSRMRSRLEPLKKFVGTVRRHYDGILAFVSTGGLTNAVGEGINRIVKIVKNRASGFRSLDAFGDMIYLTVGDLDIPAQIPPRFRTL